MGSIPLVDFYRLPFQIHKVYFLEEDWELGVEVVALDLISTRGGDGIVNKRRMLLILHLVLYTHLLKKQSMSMYITDIELVAKIMASK